MGKNSNISDEDILKGDAAWRGSIPVKCTRRCWGI